jgi:hypothetical protein
VDVLASSSSDLVRFSDADFGVRDDPNPVDSAEGLSAFGSPEHLASPSNLAGNLFDSSSFAPMSALHLPSPSYDPFYTPGTTHGLVGLQMSPSGPYAPPASYPSGSSLAPYNWTTYSMCMARYGDT